MATANEDIRDAFIRDHIRILRLARGIRNRLLRVIQQGDPEIRQLLFDALEPIAGDQRYTPRTQRRLRRLEQRLALALREPYSNATALMRRELRELAGMTVDRSIRIIQAASPVVLELSRPLASSLSRIAFDRPYRGLTSNQYMIRLRTGDLSRIVDATRIGIIQGDSATDIVRSIFGTPRLQRTDGARVVPLIRGTALAARNLSVGVSNASRQALALANQAELESELYLATLDSRTTPQCTLLDGEIFPVGVGPMPPIHINCRSLRVPALDGPRIGTRPAVRASQRELEGLTRAERAARILEVVGPVPGSTQGRDFLREQSLQFQTEVLGATIARAYRAGRLRLRDVVDERFRPLTLAQLMRLRPDAFA